MSSTVLSTCVYGSIFCIFTRLGLQAEAISVLTILIVIDFITWIIKSYFVNDEITSKRMWSWIGGKLCVLLVPFTIALVVKWAGYQADNILAGCLSLFMVAEWYSIIANVITIRTGKKFTEYDAITVVLQKILSFFQGMIDKWLPDERRNKK